MTVGLRERKKQQTRERISDVATELFVRQGFEHTTVAEVAEVADVARMTVTNYFALKEDLVFDRHEEIAMLLAGAVTDRTPGASVFQAVRAAYFARLERCDPILGFVGVEFARMVEASPALVAREREIYARQEAELAGALRAEPGWTRADLRPAIAAAVLAGVYRVLYFEGRRRLLAGETTAAILRALRKSGVAAFASVAPAVPPRLIDA